MSAQDQLLLEKAGFSASRVAELLTRTRQAVSKGVKSPRDYFSEEDLKTLSREVAAKLPSRQTQLRGAIGEVFGDLADRMKLERANDLPTMLETAELAWLIFPGFSHSRFAQPDAYQPVLDLLARRAPKKAGNQPLKLLAFYDSPKEYYSIRPSFAPEWIEYKRLALIHCDVVGILPPTIIVDPHIPQHGCCYALTAAGFIALTRAQTAAQAAAFANVITGRLGLNPLEAEPEDIADAIEAKRELAA